MAGWDKKEGLLSKKIATEEDYWALFNYLYSDSCKKRSSYKYGLIKAILDNIFNLMEEDQGMFLSYRDIFLKFAENYWNLILKYNLNQIRKRSENEISKIEKIYYEASKKQPIYKDIEFEQIDNLEKERIITAVEKECKKYVIGALYEDFEGLLYSFNVKNKGIYLSKKAYNFVLKYKPELEKLNYYSWAKYLESINDEITTTRLIEKLELSTPKRNNLSIYRELLYKEFEECSCFYCGSKIIKTTPHVDHFIPWSFTKDDKIWNFVICCSKCNEKKNNKLPPKKYINKLIERNKILQKTTLKDISQDFCMYNDNILNKMWEYAKKSGFKEINDTKI